jgi:hypothetical protein
MRFRSRSRLGTVVTGAGMLGPNLEMGLCLGVNPLGFAVGVLLAVLLVCWRVTTPVHARELPMATQPW